MKGRHQRHTILLYRSEHETSDWVARCLDFNLVGTGRTPEAALRELFDMLHEQLAIWEDLGDRAAPPTRAPQVYWDALKKAHKLSRDETRDMLGLALPPDRAARAMTLPPEGCQTSVLMTPVGVAASS